MIGPAIGSPSPHDPVRYAVALGCNTAPRLAAEWGVSTEQARHALHNAWRSGSIQRMDAGYWSAEIPDEVRR